MRLPTFFVIGAAKAGTTSLHSYLQQHPEIQMSANKEPRFFAGPDEGIPYSSDKVWDLAQYEALFDPAYPVRGESSTDYAAHPRRRGSAARIAEMLPDARFVYLVRDPVERMISHYRMGVALMNERRSLPEALGDLSDHRSQYIASSLYATQLELYREHFDPDRVLVVDQVDLRQDRARTLAEIFAFLGVADFSEPERTQTEHLSSQEWRQYSPGYRKVVSQYVSPAIRWVPPRLRQEVKRRLERRLYPPIEEPRIEGELAARINDLYGGEVERLRAMTAKPFADWSF